MHKSMQAVQRTGVKPETRGHNGIQSVNREGCSSVTEIYQLLV